MLSGSAVNVWTLGGCQWKAWSSIVVGNGKHNWICCHAPMYVKTKDKFFDTLQQTLDEVRTIS